MISVFFGSAKKNQADETEYAQAHAAKRRHSLFFHVGRDARQNNGIYA